VTTVAELALLTTASLSSGTARLDELERVLADEIKKLEPGLRATAEVDELVSVAQVLELRSRELRSRFPEARDYNLVLGSRTRGPLDDAMDSLSASHAAALSRAGLGSRVIDLLISWMGVTIQMREIERQIRALRLLDIDGNATTVDTGRFGDPVAPLSAAELGQRLGGLGDESVRQRERAGKLFSILRPGRKRGREYPACQAWPEIAGAPLERALAALAPAHGAVAYGFFNSVTDQLAGLSPIEVLVGKPLSARKLDADATRLPIAPREDRLVAIEKAAAAMAAQLTA
jgi:hypothetical protein